MNKISEKGLARHLFMHGALQKEIAERVGVTEKTIGAWKVNGQWEELRRQKESGKPAKAFKLISDSIENLILQKAEQAKNIMATDSGWKETRRVLEEADELKRALGEIKEILTGLNLLESK